jgi:xylan 1,4-beta-xylosidase
MGSPLDPTPLQVEQLNRESALPQPEKVRLHEGRMHLNLTPNTLALIEVEP